MGVREATFMGWPALVVGGALALAILLLGQYLAVLLMLRRLRLAPPVMAEHIDLRTVPPAHAELLALAAPRLRALGFEFEFASRGPAPLVTSKPCPHYSTTWCHAESGAWAVVGLSEQPEFDDLYRVAFYSFYQAGPHLYTLARRAHEQLLVLPQFDLADSGRDLEHQWQTHLERMRARDARELIRDKDTIADIERAMPAQSRAALQASDSVVTDSDGSARLTWPGALRYVRRYRQGIQRLRQMPLAPADGNGLDATAPHAAQLRAQADAIAIGYTLFAQQRDAGRRGKMLVLLTTGLASLCVFAWFFDWLFSVVLMAVLLFHELGHLLAMRAAGYRDLQVFFIPLFGAMASGREQQATAWHKMLVLLAGPLPGIVLGCALLHGAASGQVPATPLLTAATSTLLAINLFNLLPLVPLDGGRFFDVLFSARLPGLRGAFAALGAAGLLGIGLWSQTPMISVLGGVLLLGVPAQVRQARLLAALRGVHRHGMDEQGEWLQALTRLVATSGLATLPYAQRLALARSITASGLGAAPSLLSIFAGLALYGLGFALPATTLALHGVDVLRVLGIGAQASQDAPATRDIERELAATPDARARLALLLRAAVEAEDSEDYVQAYAWFERARDLTDTLPGSARQRVDAVLGMARTIDDPASARPMLEALLATLRAPDRDTRLRYAEVLMALRDDYSPSARDSDIRQLQEVVAIRGEWLPASHTDLLDARQALAWQLWQAGKDEAARAQLEERLDAVMREPCDEACLAAHGWMRAKAWSDLAWLLLALGEPAAAAQLAQDHGRALEALKSAARGERQALATLEAWVRDANGDHAGALAALEDEYDAATPLFNELQWLIDLAIFAERAAQDTAALRWHERLRERVAAQRRQHARFNLGWLRGSRQSPYAWNRLQLDAEIAWLEKHEPALLAAPAR